MTPRPTIDLRSDTITRPNEKMRRAMAEAEVGDDVFMEDPTVNQLQERAAEIFGREAALYVPSGSMGNLISIMSQTQPGQEVICDRRSHIYDFEMASLTAIAGVLPRVIDGEDGILSWGAVKAAIRPKFYALAQTSLVCIENTHNLAGGSVYPPEVIEEICEGAREAGLKTHLDGARVFNAAAAVDRPVDEITRGFDSVTFCFSKGLGAPVGSMVVGSRELIDRARVMRKRLGGGMRQVGVLAAAARVALEDSPRRLHEDHEKARLIAERLAALPGIAIDADKVRSNIVIYRPIAMERDEFLRRLKDRGVLAVPIGADKVRMVTHVDVSRPQVERAMEVVESIMSLP